MNESITMTTVEGKARYYAACRDDLAAKIHDLEAEITAARERYRTELLAAMRTHKQAEDDLRSTLEAAPHLFTKPRTRVLHGIKVGFQKGKGGLQIADESATLKLIKKHCADQIEALIKTTEKPIKDALANLDAATLKKLGVHVVDAGDAVVIKATDGDLDKLIKALQGDDGLEQLEGTP